MTTYILEKILMWSIFVKQERESFAQICIALKGFYGIILKFCGNTNLENGKLKKFLLKLLSESLALSTFP